ncbi:phosphotransferase [Amnibacterium setariae]|uniref:Macrolide 2'-phosphotransferase n=1 Tax=Amnibacterium setariae TaxID=2306585 RepID=A0A3A1U679_9MICO|nr:phosphotransferase [Amnibacterium setariae]RIX30957.1 macrolide 2'-phosphotransferase [Amnibacterium setariae]
MPRHRFTLAALATLAVPGLDVAVTRTFTGGGDGQHDAALLTDRDGEHLVVRGPVDAQAAARLEAEVAVLGVLTPGVRARLPFAVPSGVGVLPAPRAVVTTYLPGVRLHPASVGADSALAGSIGRAVAAVHELPTGVVADAGLPVATAGDAVRAVEDLIRRVDSTGEVPHELVNRWTEATADTTLWGFQPCVVHGGLAAESILVSPAEDPDRRVVGVLGWAGLQVGDPARDLAWVLGLPVPGAAGTVLDTYTAVRGRGADPAIARRALLHAELEIARWLLHGVERDDARIVDDAVQMLEALLASLLEGTAGTLVGERLPTLTVTEVERMLDARRQRAATLRGPQDTALRGPQDTAASRAPLAAQAARRSAAE